MAPPGFRDAREGEQRGANTPPALHLGEQRAKVPCEMW